jgi:hypothetical protein
MAGVHLVGKHCSPNLLAVVALTTVASCWTESWIVLLWCSKEIVRCEKCSFQKCSSSGSIHLLTGPAVLKWFLWFLTSSHCDVSSNYPGWRGKTLPYHLIIPVESHLCLFQEGLECKTFALVGFRCCNICVCLPFSTQLMWVNPVPYCCGEWIGGIGDIALEFVRISTCQQTTRSFLLYRQLSLTDYVLPRHWWFTQGFLQQRIWACLGTVMTASCVLVHWNTKNSISALIVILHCCRFLLCKVNWD